jgi:aspartyl-tRNA(Asn)/glutamyl-tRNA(Gln) amidotransferase subunit C
VPGAAGGVVSGMPMDAHIDEQQVRHIARLARLKLDEKDVSKYAARLAAILSYVRKLEELNTDEVEPTAHPLSMHNVFGDDLAAEPCDVERALENAPDRDGNFFKVPKVI